jgi:hypothetical protein
MTNTRSFQDGFVDHKGDEGDPSFDSDSDGLFGFPVAVRKSKLSRKKGLVKNGVASSPLIIMVRSKQCRLGLLTSHSA